MNDREILEDMFARRGIVYESHDAHGPWIGVTGGYPGFYAAFEFDYEGALTRVSAYE